MTRADKEQLFVLIGLPLVVGLVLFYNYGRREHDYYIRSRTREIGKDLIKTTTSHYLVSVNPELQSALSNFSHLGVMSSAVELGDEPPPSGNGTAGSRLILSNEKGEKLEIRLSRENDNEQFRVLSFWTNNAHSSAQ